MRPVPTIIVALSAVLATLVLPIAPSAAAYGSTLAFTNYAAPSGMGNFAGEPTLGVNPHTGNVIYQAGTETLRVVFDDSLSPAGATWASVGPAWTSVSNNDPMMVTDKTTGRTFAGGLDGDCSVFGVTDDDGATWNPVANSCASPSFDHETIASGPWHAPKPTQAIADRAVYYCADEAIEQCSVSYDGGTTFGAPVPIDFQTTDVANDPHCAGVVGHIKIAPDGTAYVPSKACFDSLGNAVQGVMSTTNNGINWAFHPVKGSTSPSVLAADPSIATTASSYAYMAMMGADSHITVSLTKNGGTTFSKPVDVAPGLRGIFPAITAIDDDRAAVAFLGTDGAGDPFANNFTGDWDLYIAFTYDSGATWQVVKATTDPVMRGWVCMQGTSCPLDTTGQNTSGQVARNLLDFIDATTDAQGHVLVAYADGCVDACAGVGGTPALSFSSHATIARQSGGACLAAALCGSASGTPVAAAFDDQCNSTVIIFSSNSNVGTALNGHAATCLVESFTGGLADTAFINPASDRISIRLAQDLGAGTPTVVAHVDGLGLVGATVTLTRQTNAIGGFEYDSSAVAIDPTATGSITARVFNGNTELDQVTFHTVA